MRRFSSTLRLRNRLRPSGTSAMPCLTISDAGAPPIGSALESHGLRAALRRSPHERLEERRLAGAVGADDRDGLAGRDLEIDAEQRLEVAVEGVEVVDAQHALRSRLEALGARREILPRYARPTASVATRGKSRASCPRAVFEPGVILRFPCKPAAPPGSPSLPADRPRQASPEVDHQQAARQLHHRVHHMLDPDDRSCPPR